MFNNILKNLNLKINNNLFYILILIIIILFCLDISFIYKSFFLKNADPRSILSLLLINLIIVLIVCIWLISSGSSITSIFKKNKRVSKLKKRIVFAFSIGATLPTIIITIFSTYFFNIGIESWFDKKIAKVLNQSVHVGKSYIEEHMIQIEETSRSVADDLNAMYYDLIHSSELFSKVLNAQAEMRSLDEAIVFQRNPNMILAQTKLSFSLSFTTIPSYLIEKANRGEAVRITSDPTKIRILIKLHEYNDTYLLIGRFIDRKIINHIDKTNGAAKEYFDLRNKISSIQIQFSMIFILVSLILLFVAIIWGRRFAERIVRPIKELVKAAEQVKNGDLSIQVPVEKLKKDEIKILSSSFNRMINQINFQQKELVIAEQSAAWSDVARRVAHEIKNPLTPIQLSAERLLRKFQNEVSDKDTFIRYSNNILNHSNDIKMIVSEFVDFARLPSPCFIKCEIVSMIHDLVESRKLINESINYNFITDQKKIDFVCDISQINRIIVNLLLNAEEALEDSDNPKEISIIIQKEEKYIKIIILDNGIGFNNKLLKSANKAYVTTKIKGTGLGLAIVERITIDHFGTMNISNNKNGGARIELIFNMAKLREELK